MNAVKIKLNRKGLQTLLADLSNHSMWAIHFMELGTEMSDLVTKTELCKIIAYTFRKLNWLEEELSTEKTDQQGKQIPEKEDSNHSASPKMPASLDYPRSRLTVTV